MLEQQKEQLKSYTEATSITEEKMLGQGGVKFYEFVNENGVINTKTHIAMPITIKKLSRFYELVSEIEDVHSQLADKLNALKEKYKDNPDSYEFSKEVDAFNRKHMEVINDKKLEIALLVFERTENTTKAELKNWMTLEMLNQIEMVAAGISLPPK